MSTRISLRRLLCVTSVSAFAIAMMLGGASAAHASASGACAFTGAAGPLNPGVFSFSHDVSASGGVPNALTTTDTGTYSFATPAGQTVCSGTSNGAPFASTGTITSTGNYRNTICGTGKAWSDDDNSQAYDPAGNIAPADTTNVNGSGTGTVPNVTSADYVIPFDSGVGQLTADDFDTSNVGTNGTATGAVQITPDGAHNGGNCVNEDVTQFVVEGSFNFSIP
jgi:hypothetical protein